MAEKTYPVGSIVKIGDAKAIIVGISFQETGDKYCKFYQVIKYPVGYLNERSIRSFPAEQVELVSAGYRGSHTDSYLKYMDDMDTISQHVSSTVIKEALGMDGN